MRAASSGEHGIKLVSDERDIGNATNQTASACTGLAGRQIVHYRRAEAVGADFGNARASNVGCVRPNRWDDLVASAALLSSSRSRRGAASFSPKRGMRAAITIILSRSITIGPKRPPFASAHSLSLSLSGISKCKPPKVLHWHGTLIPHRTLPAIDYTLEQPAGSILNKSTWGIKPQLCCPI